MRTTFLFGAVTILAVVTSPQPGRAWCRRSTPIWTDANPVRIVLHPDMQNHIRHVFIDPATGQPENEVPCTSSAECGTDGFCASGYASAPTSRCRGPRWTRSELERAVQWVVSRINHETPADIPFVYVDLDDTTTCSIDDPICGDATQPWVSCFQANTITVMPTDCLATQMFSATHDGSSWTYSSSAAERNMMILMRWSGNDGITWEHTRGLGAEVLETALLHEVGHALGLGHVLNDYPGAYPVCTPGTPASAPTPLCPADGTGSASGTCPVMHSDRGEGFGLSQQYFHFDDIEGLVGLYGLDSSPQTRLYEDCDLTTASFATAGTNNLPLITDMAAAPRHPLSTVGSVIVGGRARSGLYMEWFPIWEWSWSTAAAANVLNLGTPGLRSTGPIGVSASSTHVALGTHPPRLTSDHRMWRRRIRAVSRPFSGSGESASTLSPADGTAADTSVAGVSSAYHQPTNAWLHVLRDRDGQVLLVGWRPTEGWSNVLPMGFRSFAQPSIACSPNRCFIAFVEVPSRLGIVSTQTRLQWTEGTVSWPVTVPIPSNLSFTYTAGITTSWYNVVSDPVASVVSNPGGGWFYYVSTSWPQRVGGAWGTRPLVYRRSEGVQGTGALVQLTPLLPHAPGIAESPTAGATGVCAELFTSRSP